ncbi:g10055 [Coccomyxa viridis]|uniref:G10055 protein n=1 Tax=Coccomyxa viridis TaxID=1274662 RepID=A0ABP1GBF6_9CHLO
MERTSVDIMGVSGWVMLQIAIGVLMAVGWSYMRRRKKVKGGLKRYEELPGPKEWPLIRNLHHVLTGPRPQIHNMWTNLALKHGPLFRFRVPFKNFVVVSDPKLIPAILGRPGLPKTKMYQLTSTLFNPYGHDNLFTYLNTNEAEWKACRKAFAKSMSPESIRAVFPKLRDRSKLLCEEVRKKRNGAPLDVQDAMQRLALDMIMLAAFSMDTQAVRFGESVILDSLHFCFEDIFWRLAMPWRRLLYRALPWLPSARANKGYHDRLYAAWGAICDHIRTMGPYDREDGSFSAIIGTMTEPETGKLWSREKLMAHAAGVVVAGMDTTAHAVAWALYCVATYPGVQEKLVAELEGAGLLATPSMPEPRDVDLNVLHELPVLDAIIKESMRMFPVGGSGIGRYADRDIDLGGYLIPKGTEVAVCLHTMHMVPWNFPEPTRFSLDRWLQDSGSGAVSQAPDSPASRPCAEAGQECSSAPGASKQAEHEQQAAEVEQPRDGQSGQASSQPKHRRDLKETRGEALTKPYIPFSAGPRDCLGQRFGMTEVLSMMATICGRFHLELDPQMGGEAGVLERQISSFTLAVDGGLFIQFHDRTQVPAQQAASAAAVPSEAGGKAKQQVPGSPARPVFSMTASSRRGDLRQ